MVQPVSFAFSPCPNDTFAFHAMLHGRVDTRAYRFEPRIDDVESLNHDALRGEHRLSKLSFHAYLHLAGRYTLLDAGSALGYGCGPWWSRADPWPDSMARALPFPESSPRPFCSSGSGAPPTLTFTSPASMKYSTASPRAASTRGSSSTRRFVYPRYGLERLVDLGEWWEAETGLPIPLGCIAMRNDGGGDEKARAGDFSGIIRSSVRYAFDHPEDSRDFVRAHAREMDDDVTQRHIQLYVNDFTLDLGDTGRRAIQTLEEMARCRGILEPA